MHIQPAQPADLPSIQSIYASHVLTSTGTFEDTPPSLEEMTARYHANQQAGYTWLVARDASGILGYAYYGPFRTRAAYRHTVEDSIYIRKNATGQGIGTALLSTLLTHAKQAGFKQILALIGDSSNKASTKLHSTAGFHHTGTLQNVGHKLDRWLDVVVMQKEI